MAANETVCPPCCHITLHLTDTICREESVPPLYEDQSLRVREQQDGVVLYHKDPGSQRVFAALREAGDRKTLEFFGDFPYRTVPEIYLLSYLALDKTMNEHGRLLLHASFIATERGAILFTAPSGTGKSTQAALWQRCRGSEIINGDRAGIWRGADGWLAGGVPWSGTSGISRNRMLPLLAVVILHQGAENRLENVRISQKFGALMEQTTINPWNREMYLRTQEQLLDLCQSVPVYWLSCRPDEGAVELLGRELGL